MNKVKGKKTEKSKKNNKKDVKKFTPYFKKYLKESGIIQKELKERTYLSIGTVNRLINDGKATKSVVKLVAMELKLKEPVLEQMLSTPYEYVVTDQDKNDILNGNFSINRSKKV